MYGLIRVFDAATGKEKTNISFDSGGITALAVSDDGGYVLTGGSKQSLGGELTSSNPIRLWNIKDALLHFPADPNLNRSQGECGCQIMTFNGHSGTVYGVAFLGRDRVVSASGDNTIRIWNASTGDELQRFVTEKSLISASFSADGRIVLISFNDGTADLRETETGKVIRVFARENGKITATALSSDGHSILMGLDNGSALLVELSGHHVQFSSSISGAVSAELASDGASLLSTTFTNDGTVTGHLWRIATGKIIKNFESIQGESAGQSPLFLSPDGRFVLGGGEMGTATLYNASDSSIATTFKDIAMPMSFSRDGSLLLARSSADAKIARLWNVTGAQVLGNPLEHSAEVTSVAISPTGTYLLTISQNEAKLWNMHKMVKHWEKKCPCGKAEFSANGKWILGPSVGEQHVWRAEDGFDMAVKPLDLSKEDLDHDPVAASGYDEELQHGVLDVFDLGHPPADPRFGEDPKFVKLRFYGQFPGGSYTASAFSEDGLHFAQGFSDGSVVIFDIWGSDGQPSKHLNAGAGVTDLRFSADGTLLITASSDGKVQLWNARADEGEPFEGGAKLRDFNYGPAAEVLEKAPITLLESLDGNAVVIGPDNRFDSSDVEHLGGFNWKFSDSPFRGLSADVLMRDYYEPGLLPQLLAGKELPKIRSLASLNRVQPVVVVNSVWQDASTGLAKVTVAVRSHSDPEMKNRKTFTKPYDVRVFRDGQLVGWAPKTSVEWQLEAPPSGRDAEKNTELDLQRWREKTEIKNLGPDGTKELTFLVQVPRRADLKQVTFTAYAFNEDRVKSATASTILTVDKPLKARVGKAYVISVGVNRTENSSAWKLNYAANDARQMSKVVGDKLGGTKQFGEVVRVRLVSDAPGKQEAGEAAATKVHLQAVLDVLAGRREMDEVLKKEIPDIAHVAKAEPEDLVLLSFSSHGYTDDRGVFHIVLWDIGKDTPQDKITPELQGNSLSSDVLSGWLRDVDSGEMTMIVDACHSEATVAAEGFKPGPMGSRGLGQLAYDKGMRILAASKSNEEAMELGGPIKQGLLSYALIEEGLVEGKAAKGGKILMSNWLSYGEQEVPNLYKAGKVKGPKGEQPVAPNGRDIIYLGPDQAPSGYQQPVLFDFAKGQADIVLSAQ
jgi:WD40 repeat protein